MNRSCDSFPAHMKPKAAAAAPNSAQSKEPAPNQPPLPDHLPKHLSASEAVTRG